MVVGPSRVAGTLAAHLADVDATRFVGRSPLLARVDRLLAGEEATRVLLVHGPGGIGKSALLREVDRRARAAGRPTWMVDARHLGPALDELHRAVEAAHDRPGAVVLIDSFERVGALGRQRREELLGNLAEDALVVVAGRGVPSPAWFHDGWEHVVTDVPLGPLSPDEARALLAARGVTDPGIVDGLVRWAAGSPLALSLAAAGSDADGNAAGGSRTGRSPDGMPGGVDLNELIVRRLAGDELGAVDREVLDVAAVARAVDARLLAAVLPGRPTRPPARRCGAPTWPRSTAVACPSTSWCATPCVTTCAGAIPSGTTACGVPSPITCWSGR